jgi:4-hydroxy-tetrahydrodipicolinate reductase
MKIALIGYGKMGKLIEQLALSQGHEIVARFSKQHSYLSFQQTFEEADVVIDFSHFSCVMDNVRLCIEHRKNLIIGTTGWEKQKKEIETMIRASSIGCLYAPNFSIGIHLFMQIIRYAAQLINPFNEYDVAAVEYHHRGKKDSPSGTAKVLTQQLLNEMDRLNQFEFASIRCGHIPGTHTIHFDCPVDTLTLTHQARNREGFAYGAIQAAEWIKEKKGFFTLEDMLKAK